ncbi:MAG: oligosaccharide flippase family protein [Candidatus Kapaibacterium sp.]
MSTTTASSSSTRAAAGAGILFISQILGNALYFLIQRTIISELPKESFGGLSFVQQTCSLLLVVIVDAGMNNIAVREILHHPARERQIVAASFWIRLGTSLASVLLLSAFFLWNDASLVAVGMMCIAAMSVSGRMTMMRSSMELPLRAGMEYGLIAVLFLLDTALYAAAVWMYAGHLTPITILTLQALTALPGFLILAVRVRALQILFPLPAIADIRHMLRQTRAVTSQLVLQNVHAGLDIFVLRFTSSLSELAVFGAVANISVIILTLYNALSTAVYPLLAQRNPSDDPSLTHARIVRSLSVVSFASMSVAAVLCALAPLIVRLFTKNTYIDHVTEFQLQFWCTVAIVLSQFVLVVNTALNVHRAVLFSGVSLVLGSLMFDFLLIPGLGTRGMLIAKAASNLLSAGVGLWFVARSIGSAPVLRFLVRLVPVGATLCIASMSILGPVPSVVQAALAIAALSAVSGALSGMVTMSDVRLFTSMAARLMPRRNPRSTAQG